MKTDFDVVVLGAGSGGLTSAVGFSKAGKRVLLIEKEHMGGECTNSGCIPSKALLHHAKTFAQAVSLSGETTKNQAYRDQAFTYVRKVVDDILEEETPAVFEALGITVLRGEAEFVSTCAVRVNDTEYSYKTAVIATGSSPRTFAIPGLSKGAVLTNQNLFQQSTIAQRLLIVGSGPIGLEMGQAFALLGSQVTIATIDSEFARLEDVALRPILKQRFDELDIKVYLNAHIKDVTGNTAHFTVKREDQEHTNVSVLFDAVLLAIGRVPNLPSGLEQAGIKTTEHGIAIDSQHRTSNKYVYAVGDVAQRLKFTHTADDTARQVVARVVSRGLLRVNTNKAVPKVTYTDPELAQVGLSHDAALTKYGADRVMRIEVPFTQNDRAKTDSATTGTLVVIARRLNGAVLGAHCIGPRAGELISLFTLAIEEKVSLWRFQKLILAYPTYSLVAKKAGDIFVGRQLSDVRSDIGRLLIRNAPKLIAAAVWIGLLYALSSYQTSHDMNTTQTALKVFDFVSMTAWGPLVYILFYTIRPVTFFPATALTILSGIFFGFVLGTILSIIAATLSAAVAYSVGRFFGNGLRLEDSVFGNFVNVVRRNTFETILFMRLTFMPFDGVSYFAGILKTNVIPFLSSTFLGILLGTATFVSIGASLNLEEFKMEGFSFSILEPKFLLLSGGIFVLSIGVSRILKRWKATS